MCSCLSVMNDRPLKYRKTEGNYFLQTITSRLRDSGTIASGTLTLPNDIYPESVELLSLNVPPFYNITERNNAFAIDFNTGGTVVYVMPVGSYSASALATQFAATVLAQSSVSVTLTIDPITFLSTFSYPAGNALDALNMTFDSRCIALGRLLGFSTTSPVAIGATRSVLGVRGAVLNMRNLYLRISEMPNRGRYRDSFSTPFSYTFDINLKNDHAGTWNLLDQYYGLGKQKITLPRDETRPFQTITYELRDENGDVMNYLNIDWTITFKFVLYDQRN